MAANQSNLSNPDLWIRLVYMILFWLFTWLARLALGAMGAIQFVLLLINGDSHAGIRRHGEALGLWMQQTCRFVTFASDEKPFPFQDWPVAEADEPVADDSAEAEAPLPTVTETCEDDEPKRDSTFGNLREP